MFSANDMNGNLIDIDDAIHNSAEIYLCPSCSGELVIKSGNVRVSHFSHKTFNNCDYSDNDMSEWHRNWQKRFPLKNREVVLKLDKDDPFAEHYKHLTRRADVLCYGYAIEFQNSPITSEEYDERCSFYNKLGYKVVWIFNMIEPFKNKKMVCYDEWHGKNDNGGKYSWDYASKTFISYDPSDKGVILFFQIVEIGGNAVDKEQCYLERITWAVDSDTDLKDTSFKRFCTSYNPGNFTELMGKLRRKEL